MAELPLHPRLAHMLLEAGPLHLTALACEVAALLSERDILRGSSGQRNADLRLRLDILHGQDEHVARASIDRGACQRVKRIAELWRKKVTQCAYRHQVDKRQSDEQEDFHAVGLLLGFAYPDRIAQRQGGSAPRYLLMNGRGAVFMDPDPLASEPYLAIADVDGESQWARINLAAPIALAEIETLYADGITETEAVSWDEKAQAVRATRQRRLGPMILSEQTLARPDRSLVAAALLEGIRQAGPDLLPWTPELRQWQARVQFLRLVEGDDSPWLDLSDESLLRTLEDWLGPSLDGVTTLDQVKRLDLSTALHALLSWDEQRRLERQAPTHLTVPSGSNIRLEYGTPHLPILAVQLQELFGCKETPLVVDGKVPLMLHLLSPARRPVQVTQDLASFWANAYQEVRKALRGRYPKHYWPEDPLAAPPTAKTKRPV